VKKISKQIAYIHNANTMVNTIGTYSTDKRPATRGRRGKWIFDYLWIKWTRKIYTKTIYGPLTKY